jgi:hypothetical protein
MNTALIRNSASAGFNEALILLNFLKQHEPLIGEPVPPELKMMRGLFFVQLYGTFEAIILMTMVALLRSIKSMAPEAQDIENTFYVVALSSNWKSIKDQGYRKIFSQMRNFFDFQKSEKLCEIDENLFSLYLQNISGSAIEELYVALGMELDLPISTRVLLNELVDNRNKVAHGRESAAVVGGRYSINDLQNKFGQVQEFTLSFIDTIELFFESRSFIRSIAREKYA